MSELITDNYKGDFRLGLMTTACALALLASAADADFAKAEDAERPTVWIELGGQLERAGGTGDRFTAPFMTLAPTPEPYKFASPLDAVRAPRYAIGGEGKISFEPEGTNWVFSAAIRYGRSNGNKTAKHQTDHLQYLCSGTFCTGPVMPTAPAFVKASAKHRESHSILDFMVGKDVGLGMFGHLADAVLSAGVRYAQFSATSDVKVYAVPTVALYNAFPIPGPVYIPGRKFNSFRLSGNDERNFHAVGPSISVSGSTPVVGTPDTTELEFDWGGNAAVLFGRQRTRAYHQTLASQYRSAIIFHPRTYAPLYPSRSHAAARTRSVTVPNVGAFAAISLKFPNAKVSLGYRGDFFFGANDAGIDARKEDTLSFHGPYATISIGLGG